MRGFIQGLSGGYMNLYDYDYILIPTYGQSLSINSSSTPRIIPTSTKALQFSNGIFGTPNGSSTLVPLTISNDICTNVTNMIFSKMNVNSTSVVVSTSPGLGGALMSALIRGTAPYNKLIAGVTQMKRIADSEGKTLIVPAIPYVQGESEMAYYVNNFNYTAALISLSDDLNTDIKAITGQCDDVVLLVSQVASHVDYGRYPRIAIQQYDASFNSDKIWLSKSMYNGDYVVDDVHGTTQLYGLMGARFGYQIYDGIIRGNTRSTNGIRLRSHTYNALKSTLIFDVPVGPLVLDVNGDVTEQADGNYGFKLFDVFESTTDLSLNTISEPSAIITNVVLINSNTIEITYSESPVGSRLTYAVNGLEWQQVTGVRDLGQTGRVEGARGNLRDNQGNTVKLVIRDDMGVEMFNDIHNWCPIFEIQL